MKTYKKGISLIVLVITIIVLSILATVVITSISESNIINEASAAAFKSDMSSYKERYQFYLTNKLFEDNNFKSSTLNVASTDTAKFTEIFGDSIKDEYKNNFEIVAGRLVYKTTEREKVNALNELNMAITVVPATMAIGDKVVYTPTANPTGTYTGATYVKDTVTTSPTYNTYIESTTNYTPGTMTWVYLGQDEKGNVLLTSEDTTSFTMTIGGQDGFVTGPDRIDALCNTLYGNSTYGETRNMKREDLDRTLEYDGNLGRYMNVKTIYVETSTPRTFRELETKEGLTISNRKTPRLSTIAFEDILSDTYTYVGTKYKDEETNEYRVIFKKADKTTNLSGYWLSSSSAEVYFSGSFATFFVHHVNGGVLAMSYVLFFSNGDEDVASLALRPVIVLKSNVQFGEKNADNAWTLEVM